MNSNSCKVPDDECKDSKSIMSFINNSNNGWPFHLLSFAICQKAQQTEEPVPFFLGFQPKKSNILNPLTILSKIAC